MPKTLSYKLFVVCSLVIVFCVFLFNPVLSFTVPKMKIISFDTIDKTISNCYLIEIKPSKMTHSLIIKVKLKKILV